MEAFNSFVLVKYKSYQRLFPFNIIVCPKIKDSVLNGRAVILNFKINTFSLCFPIFYKFWELDTELFVSLLQTSYFDTVLEWE